MMLVSLFFFCSFLFSFFLSILSFRLLYEIRIFYSLKTFLIRDHIGTGIGTMETHSHSTAIKVRIKIIIAFYIKFFLFENKSVNEANENEPRKPSAVRRDAKRGGGGEKS